MDINKANEISSTQVFIFIVASQISFGILKLGGTLAQDVGHDGWIAVLIAGLLVCVLIYMMMGLLGRFNNMSIQDINLYLFGKVFGNFLNLIFIIYPFYATVIVLRMFTDIIGISVLELTPGIVVTSFIIIPIVYLSWYGLKYICRFSTLKPLLLTIIVLYYLLLSTYFRGTFLQPVGTAGLVSIIKGSYDPFSSYLGFELLSIFYPHIRQKDKSVKYAILGNITTMSFYIFTVVFLTGFFGEAMLKQLQYPIFSLARAYRAPILERLDLFFIALWFPIMETVLQLYYYSAYYSIRKLLKIEEDKKKSKLLLLIFTLSVIALSRIPKDMIQLDKFFEIFSYMGTAFVIHILLCYLFSFIKKPGGVSNEKTS
ncbi:MAG: hypothetical protein K0R84_2824 [Clostridia bacterium]|jgi:spore germination protein (amino acid permease)|nr:hypothetical protein [Clostridia bacterium]